MKRTYKIGLYQIPYETKPQNEIQERYQETYEGDDIVLGAYFFMPEEIWISEELSKERKFVSTLHEILECIKRNHELDMPHSVLSSLSELLGQVIIDNKQHFINDLKKL